MNTSPRRKEFDYENDELVYLQEMNSTIQSCLEHNGDGKDALRKGQSSDGIDVRSAFVSASVLDQVYNPIRSELTRLRQSAASELSSNSKKLFKRQDRFIAISVNDEESSPSLYGTPLEPKKQKKLN